MRVLEEDLKSAISFYWRFRSGLALFKENLPSGLPNRLEYLNTPIPCRPGYSLSVEPTRESFDAMIFYGQTHLAKDTFLLQIAALEAYVVRKLRQKALSTAGTLGAMQKRLQGTIRISAKEIAAIDEIREARNCLIHDHGIVTQRYLDALGVATSLNIPVYVPGTISIGDTLTISSEKLAATIDSVIDYAAST